MSDVTGKVYKYQSIDTPLFCGKSGLFLVVDENPYEGECYVRVYKMLPEGRLAEVAALNRGGEYYSEVDLDNFVWVGESSFIANRKTLEAGLQCDFYGGCSDSSYGRVQEVRLSANRRRRLGLCARRSSS